MKYFFLFLIINISSIALGNEEKDAETLVSNIQVEIQKNGTSKESYEQVEKILTQSGRMRLSNIKIPYMKSLQDFKLIEAYSLTNGQKIEVALDRIIVRSADVEQNGLSDRMEAIIPFDNLTIGSEVHLRYQYEIKPYWGNISSKIIGFTKRSLAKKEIFTVISEVPLQVMEKDFGMYFTLKKENLAGKHTLRVQPTTLAYVSEGKAEQDSLLSYTTAQSWEEIQKIGTEKFKKALHAPLPPKYESIFKSVKALKDPKSIFDKVAEDLNKTITYAGDWQTVEGKFEPRMMAWTALQGRGDCKDYTTAMVAILRKLGFDANPFLTFRSQSYQGHKNLMQIASVANPHYFNHVIVHIKDKAGQDWWVDPTNPYVQAESISYDILGNFGILLDGKSKIAAFIPAQNKHPSNFSLEQTVSLASDQSIQGKALINMSSSSYNIIAMVERLYGPEATAKVFTMMLNPTSQKTKIKFNKPGPTPTTFELQYHGQDWVTETKGSTTIDSFHPLTLLSSRIGSRQDIDLGEPGKMTYKTLLKSQKAVDSSLSQCLIRTPWMDVDRYVENKTEGIEIKDIIEVKQRFISREDADGDVFDAFLSKFSSCLYTSRIITRLDESQKSAEDLANEKVRGPSLEVMTRTDAEKLNDLEGPSLTPTIRLKLYRFYEKLVAKNPKDADAVYNKALHLAELGYLHTNLYQPTHLQNAISLINDALPHASEEKYPLYASTKGKYELFFGNLAASLHTFHALRLKSPNHFSTYYLAALIAESQKKFKEAEAWLLAGSSAIKTKKDKKLFHWLISINIEKQNRIQDAITHRVALTNLEPNNAWAWHNLAALHYANKDYDKVIEVENKALSLAEFGAAKQTLSNAYYKKYKAIEPTSRTIASGRPEPDPKTLEDLLLNSLKHYDRNVDALVSIAQFYFNEYGRKKEPFILSKGRSYLDQAADINPNHPQLQAMRLIYHVIEKPTDGSWTRPKHIPSLKRKPR